MLAVYCIIVFIGSSVSRLPRELNKFPDYVLHLVEYFIMGILANLAFRSRPLSYGVVMSAVVAALFCLAYGVSDEFHQYFVTGRSASLPDIGSDLVGAVMAQLLLVAYRYLRRPRTGGGG